MKPHLGHFLLLSTSLLGSLGHAEEQRQAPLTSLQRSLSRTELATLEHACKLAAAMNALDWKTVEAAAPPNDGFLRILRDNATHAKDWHGVGAYRKSDHDADTRTLTHHFAYGHGRNTPHLVSFRYTLDGDKFAYNGITILGW